MIGPRHFLHFPSPQPHSTSTVQAHQHAVSYSDTMCLSLPWHMLLPLPGMLFWGISTEPATYPQQALGTYGFIPWSRATQGETVVGPSIDPGPHFP